MARPGHGRGRSPTPDEGREEEYRLLTIEPARPPEGCTGRDWLVYRIGQGDNVITGYRQGDVRAATAEVEKIVVGLNERRIASKGRPGPKPKSSGGGSAGAAPAAASADADESES